MASVLNFRNPVFAAFAFHSGAIIIKTICMSIITTINRFARNAFANPEDLKSALFKPEKDKELKMTLSDPAVERIRRCHLNDLENVVPFVLLGFLYVLTEPEVDRAILYFRLFTGFRFAHTVAYLLPLPQPSRAACFMGNFTINMLMAYSVLTNGVF